MELDAFCEWCGASGTGRAVVNNLRRSYKRSALNAGLLARAPTSHFLLRRITLHSSRLPTSSINGSSHAGPLWRGRTLPLPTTSTNKVEQDCATRWTTLQRKACIHRQNNAGSCFQPQKKHRVVMTCAAVVGISTDPLYRRCAAWRKTNMGAAGLSYRCRQQAGGLPPADLCSR